MVRAPAVSRLMLESVRECDMLWDAEFCRQTRSAESAARGTGHALLLQSSDTSSTHAIRKPGPGCFAGSRRSGGRGSHNSLSRSPRAHT